MSGNLDMQAEPVIIISVPRMGAGIEVFVHSAPPACRVRETYPTYRLAFAYASGVSAASGWPIRDEAEYILEGQSNTEWGRRTYG